MVGVRMMSNSSLVTVSTLSQHRSVGRNKQITKITIHHAAGVLSVESMLGWFVNPDARASSQYTVGGDGRVGMSVEEKDRAWTSSSSANDNAAITIEVINSAVGGEWPVSERAFETLISLCVDICMRNPGITQRDGKPGLYFDGTPGGSLTHHQMFAATGCPGPFLLSRFPRICDEVNARLALLTGVSPGVPEVPGAAPPPIAPGTSVPEVVPGSPAPSPGADLGKDTPSVWHSGDWEWAMALRTPDGVAVTDGTDPRGLITREQSVSMLRRVVSILEDRLEIRL